MTRVLIVGSGITGAVVASLIKKYMQSNCHITVWEKSRCAGGRMNTSLRSSQAWCSVDLGAQYISPTPQEYQNHALYYKDLEDCGVLRPMTCLVEGDRERPEGTKHFIAPLGMRSLVKHFLSSSGATLHYGKPLSSLSAGENGFIVSSSRSANTDVFDCVVLTVPVPELLRLGGDLPAFIESQQQMKSSLQNVVYSSRFAIGLFFETGTNLGLNWSVKYFDDPMIRYIAVDTDRRSVDSKMKTMVVHTTVQFGLESCDQDIDEVCFDIILPQLYKILPQLPQAAFVISRYWNYSQVYVGYPGSPGAIVLNKSPLLVAGGDAFTYSKFDGCISSASQLVSTVAELVSCRNS